MSTPADEPRRVSGVQIAALVIVLLAAGCRLVRLKEWPVPYALPVQYESAICARVFRLSISQQSLPEGRRQWLEARPQNVTAPPVMQALMAGTYLLSGTERPWLSGLLASGFWLLGGWFLFDLCRKLAGGSLGALAALAFYLLAPLGIIVSRCFQPEALMTFAFLVALWYLVRFDAAARRRSTLVAGLVSGLAVLVKPGFYLLPLLAAYLALALKARGVRRTFLSPDLYIFGALLCLPSVLYTLLFIPAHVEQKIIPGLLLSLPFYGGWAAQVNVAVGWTALGVAVVGACVMWTTHDSPLGLALLAAYVGYSALFTWHTLTHSHYHIPLIPIIAICIAPLSETLLRAVPWGHLPLPSRAVCALVLFLAGLALAWPAVSLLGSPDWRGQPRRYEEIGARLGEGTKVIALGGSYDYPLCYHGWLVTRFWPYLGDKEHELLRTGTVVGDRQRLRGLRADFGPAYFVITDYDRLREQPELAALLEKHYPVSFRDEHTLIYDLRNPLRPLDGGE